MGGDQSKELGFVKRKYKTGIIKKLLGSCSQQFVCMAIQLQVRWG